MLSRGRGSGRQAEIPDTNTIRSGGEAKQIKLLHNECKNELHFSISVSVLLAAVVVATILVVVVAVVEHSKNNSREK